MALYYKLTALTPNGNKYTSVKKNSDDIIKLARDVLIIDGFTAVTIRLIRRNNYRKPKKVEDGNR